MPHKSRTPQAGRLRRWSGRGLVLFLVAVLAFSPNAVAGDEKQGPGPLGKPDDGTTYGYILVPTAKQLRSYSLYSGHGVTQYQVAVTPGAEFKLSATGPVGSQTCVLGVCTTLGDFDVVFFQENPDGSTRVTGRHDAVGEETGTVPAGSSFAYVYLTTPSSDPGFRGFKFAYWQGQAPSAEGGSGGGSGNGNGNGGAAQDSRQ